MAASRTSNSAYVDRDVQALVEHWKAGILASDQVGLGLLCGCKRVTWPGLQVVYVASTLHGFVTPA